MVSDFSRLQHGKDVVLVKELFDAYTQALSHFYAFAEAESLTYYAFTEVLGLSRLEIHFQKDKELKDNEFNSLLDILLRLKNMEPIQYIFGWAYFYDLEFDVNQHVLIPRQETEELVDLIINKHKKSKPKILDIGTGSGCIAISLSINIKDSEVSACDISMEALDIAQKNAQKNNAQVKFENCNILSFYETLFYIPEYFDVIVSNPPYIRNSEKNQMHENVLNYEPNTALFVEDENPLLFYEKICKFAKYTLKKGGKLYFEINEALGDEIKNLLLENNFTNINIHLDLNGKKRFAECSKYEK